jgi:hypothetical protein
LKVRFEAAVKDGNLGQAESIKNLAKAMDHLFGVLNRLVCYLVLVEVSRAVGVPDLEVAYSEAVERIGGSPPRS